MVKWYQFGLLLYKLNSVFNVFKGVRSDEAIKTSNWAKRKRTSTNQK